VSGGLDHEDLSFLSPGAAGRPLRQRTGRWQLPLLHVWLSLAETSAAFMVGVGLVFAHPAGLGSPPPEPGVLAALMAALVLRSTGKRTAGRRLRFSAWACQIVAAGVAGGVVLLLGDVPPDAVMRWVAGEVLVAGAVIGLLRLAFTRLVALMLGDGRLATHIAVVGDGPAAARTMARLSATDPHLLHVIGQYVPAQGPWSPPHARGTLRTLLSDCRMGVVDTIVLAVEPGDAEGLRRLQATLRPCIQEVYLAAELIAEAPETAQVRAFGSTPLMLVREPPIRGWPRLAKLAMDQVGALMLLTALSGVLLAVAIAIRLETPGPLMFRQLRVGYNNKLFYMYKFRSMHDGATDRMAKQQTVRGDMRVTRVGRVIRRLSLDELPQLLNVLRGEMSLVGPRPHAPGTSVSGQRIHTLVYDYDCRHLVLPGLTGLAQMRGLRGGLQDRQQVAERLDADLEYIRTWSLWLDLKILIGTLVAEIRGGRGC